ncbi:hypothetical protein Zmor_002020 [Zophobas morio]|uniref:Uncharacterized protein n=1 Tax=Zophobas morio TaxID=2755281 RepID=A0AA38J022_9CUCU|nr:hypothetical protein Zmor_002020 [Zophobas morio]
MLKFILNEETSAFLAKERDSGEPLLPLTAVQDRVAAALGVCANSELRGTTNKNRRRCTFSQEIETPEQSKCVILALRSSVLFENTYMEWSKKKYMLHDRHYLTA